MESVIFCRSGHFVAFADEILPARNFDEFQMVMAQPRLGPIRGTRNQFCTECGEPIVQECEHCQAPIDVPNMMPGYKPAYCGRCGKAYPWTQTALAAAKEFADELELSDDDKAKLKATFDDLTVDTPRTELAAHRFRNFMRKIGPAAGDVLTKIIVNVATEAAKKGMGM